MLKFSDLKHINKITVQKIGHKYKFSLAKISVYPFLITTAIFEINTLVEALPI